MTAVIHHSIILRILRKSHPLTLINPLIYSVLIGMCFSCINCSLFLHNTRNRVFFEGRKPLKKNLKIFILVT